MNSGKIFCASAKVCSVGSDECSYRRRGRVEFEVEVLLLSGLSPTDSDKSEGGSDARRRADVPSVTAI